MTSKQRWAEGKLGYLSLLTILAALVAALFLWDNWEKENVVHNESSFTSNESEKSSTVLGPKDPRADEVVSNSASSIDQAARVLGSQEVKYLEDDKKRWELSRGYFDESDYELYASYDGAAIKKLASSGDLLALAIWAKSLKKQDHDKEAFQTKMISAMYGSSEALVSISTVHETKSWDKDISEQEKLHHVKAMLVYAEIAAMRGDRNGVVSGLLELNRQGVELSKDDIIEISTAAKEIYSGLEEQRELLGLGPFDNEEDPFVQAQMDFMASPIPNSNGWATEYIGEKPEVVYVDPKSSE